MPITRPLKCLPVTALAAMLFLGGCMSAPPSGPSGGQRAMVLPGSGKSFEQFRLDDNDCRGYANAQLGGETPRNASHDSALRSAAVGTAVGAVAGAVMGGQHGAAIGAGTGLLLGSATGMGNSQSAVRDVQQRYDNSYLQCMYAKGHQIPMSGRLMEPPAPVAAPTAAAARRNMPPPPPPAPH
jgi:hypothetical protein